MKRTIPVIILLSIFWFNSCGNSVQSGNKELSDPNTVNQVNSASDNQLPNNAATAPENEGTVIQLTKAMFLEKVYDYEKNPKQWQYKGEKPCIIDFYADWCRPCKQVAPIMAEFSEKYKGQVIIYKVNTDQERELAQFFGIRSIPTVFFCPATGDPQMTQGALPKETFEKIISDVLLKK